MTERDELHPDDTPPEPKPDDPFMPIVESLLSLDERKFREGLEVAGPAEIAEARRQTREETRWTKERQAAIEQRLDELRAQYPGIDEETDD
jgi:hypothetical protein